MKSLANFLLFQVGWFGCVLGASHGQLWTGPAAVLAVVALHLVWLARPGERGRELVYLLAVGLAGTLLDTLLGAIGATRYPGTEAVWAHALVPPWITALWVLFATLPAHSLRWLAGRPVLAAVLGAVGGPLSFLAGTRFGAVAVGEPPLLTWVALTVQYALVTPLLLALAPVPSRASRS